MNYAPLTPKEVMDLTCMQAGVPWNCQAELVELFAIYDKLRSEGQRPFDPASLPEAEHDAYWEGAAVQAPTPGAASQEVQNAAWRKWADAGTVASLIGYLATLDQAAPIVTAYHVNMGNGERRCKTRSLTISRERVDHATATIRSSDTSLPYTHVLWAQPREEIEAPAVVAELPPGVVVSAYRIGDDINAIRVERAQQIDGPDLWAVRRHGDVLNRSGEWEWEPMPSNRDDEFLARCRFSTHTEAIAMVSRPPVQKPGGA